MCFFYLFDEICGHEKELPQNNLRNFLEYSIKIFWWEFSTPVLTTILVSCCSLKSNSMILLLVFGSRPQWLMNFARSLLNLTRGKTLILSPTRRGAKCKSILRYRRPSMESLYLQNNWMNEKGDKNKRNKMGKNFTFAYYSMLSDDRNTYFGPYFLVWSRV